MKYKETWLVVYIAFDSIFYAYLVPILKLIETAFIKGLKEFQRYEFEKH